jgi:hypothetical protein
MEAIESCLNKELRLIRVMPNIAAAVKEAATAVAAGKHASEEDIKLAMAIFDSIGKTVFIAENYLMDAITGLSGSGPAYIFLIVEAMADAGVKVGLSRQEALFLSAQTVLGAAKMLMETQEHPGQLRDRVTSPGGTAIAGLATLEKGGLRTTLILSSIPGQLDLLQMIPARRHVYFCCCSTGRIRIFWPFKNQIPKVTPGATRWPCREATWKVQMPIRLRPLSGSWKKS